MIINNTSHKHCKLIIYKEHCLNFKKSKENIVKSLYGIKELDNMILEINKIKNRTYLKES
jgi:hypothetical protein